METRADGQRQYFAWLTGLPVGVKMVEEIAQKGGRDRWKVDNEGFNRQKNPGLNLEHVYMAARQGGGRQELPPASAALPELNRSLVLVARAPLINPVANERVVGQDPLGALCCPVRPAAGWTRPTSRDWLAPARRPAAEARSGV